MTAIEAFFSGPGPFAKIAIMEAKGSSPRAAGVFMFVSPSGQCGTIGGGQLEYRAIDAARNMLVRGDSPQALNIQLGPQTGQCCGGAVVLALAQLDADEISREITDAAGSHAARQPVYIFGSGHVGRALAGIMAQLPVRSCLIDSRAGELALAPDTVEKRLRALPEAELRTAPAGSAFVIMTHLHGLDFSLASEALARGDARYVGMIGSRSKRASFASWCARNCEDMPDMGHLACPVGSRHYKDKQPEIIAVHTASEIIDACAGYTRCLPA